MVTAFPPVRDHRVPRWLVAGFAAGLVLVALQTHGGLLLRGLVFGTTRLHPEHQLNVPAAGLAIACWLAPLACASLGRGRWLLAALLWSKAKPLQLRLWSVLVLALVLCTGNLLKAGSLTRLKPWPWLLHTVLLRPYCRLW